MAKERSTLGKLIVEPFQEWSRDNASTLAAALAYYAVMSLVPLLVIVVVIASYFLKTDQAINQLAGQIGNFTSPEVANLVKGILTSSKNPVNGSISSIVSIVTLVLGASGIFSQLRSSMNIVWNVPPVTKGGFKRTVKNKGAALLMVIAVGVLFLVFLAIEAFVSILINTIPAGSQNRLIATIINYVVQFLLLMLLIALIFKSVPDKHISWGDVFPGAALTAILFIVGRFLIGLYLSFNKTASGYGAAGSLVILLIWIFYSAQIFFFGAEFTQVYARTVGSHKGLPEDAKLKGEDEDEEAVVPEKSEPVLEKVPADNPPTDGRPKDSNPSST